MKGLVLSGGGAKGAYQVGVIKALNQLGYDYKCITGTSVGAINGAFIAQGDFEGIYTLWTELTLSDVIAGNSELLEKLINLDIKAQDFHQLLHSFRGIVERNGLDITPFKKLLGSKLSEQKIRASSIDLGVVTVSLTDLKPLEIFKGDIPQGLLVDYLIASANLPVFNLSRLEGKLFIDGGFYDNLPINLMASRGIKDIVAVNLGAIGMIRKTEDQNLNIRLITPSEDVGMLLEITPAKAKRNLEMGYMDALKAFKKVEGINYYFEPQDLEERVAYYLWNITPQNITLESYFPIKGMSFKRAIFEKVLPYFVEMLKLDPQVGYTGICIAIIEEMAVVMELERIKTYTYVDLAHSIEEKRRAQETEPVPPALYPLGWTSALLTKKQRIMMLDLGWEIVKGVFLDEGI